RLPHQQRPQALATFKAAVAHGGGQSLFRRAGTGKGGADQIFGKPGLNGAGAIGTVSRKIVHGAGLLEQAGVMPPVPDYKMKSLAANEIGSATRMAKSAL